LGDRKVIQTIQTCALIPKGSLAEQVEELWFILKPLNRAGGNKEKERKNIYISPF